MLGQLSGIQQRTMELEKNTSLDWRMQATEDDLTAVQKRLQGGTASSSHDGDTAQSDKQVQECPTDKGEISSSNEGCRIQTEKFGKAG